MRRALLLVLALLGLSIYPVGTATALSPCRTDCSCMGTSMAEQVEAADVVAVVTVRDVDKPTPETASTDPAHYELTVDEAIKGDTDPTITVSSPVSGASCGVEMTTGQSYVLFADRADGGTLRTELCSGTAPKTTALVDEVRDEVPSAERGEVLDAQAAGTASDDVPSEPGRDWLPVVLGGGFLLVGAVAVAAVARATKRR